MLASAPADRTAKLWHFGGPRYLKDLVTSWSASRPILAAAYAPDGTVLAVATTDKTVHIRDAKTGDVVKTPYGQYRPGQLPSPFHPDGKMLGERQRRRNGQDLGLGPGG